MRCIKKKYIGFILFFGLLISLNEYVSIIKHYDAEQNQMDESMQYSSLPNTFVWQKDNITSFSKFIATKKEAMSEIQEFNTLTEAHAFMEKVALEKIRKIIIRYPNFTQHLPHFIEQSDETLFLKSRLNNENLKPPKSEQLLGIVEVIKDGTFISRDYDCGYKADNNFARKRRKPTPGKSFDILAPIIVPHAFEFQHFYDGTLPKIMQAYPLLMKPNVKIILEPPVHANIDLVLANLGLNVQDKVIFHPMRDRTTVYHANYMIMTCIAPPLHPVLWKDSRTRLQVPPNLPVSTNEHLIMLLTRAGAQKPGRNMVNEKVVRSFLKERYGKQFMVFKGGYTLKEAMDLFSRTRIIIGVHGGAFYNMNYAPYSSTIIEIGPMLDGGRDIGLPHAIFWAMAELLGQTYWRIPAVGNSRGDVTVDMDKLERILDVVDASYK